ncbi:FAD-dependent monooxygenase [Williamsia sp.]|uniref:FAD-dependent monooxygenase n=1 Tax=Williamsia sp. TaxID=1872085 RepID=UPI001A23C09B|nr:FAD-dependent monooxygenase [Williamsia sp.]MBJ7289694.1 FAD-dependent monooxygenase [Williamsia sp.]
MTPHCIEKDVLIVGAGPVGLVMACELLQQGFSVRLIERGSSSAVHSRAVITWPRSLELLRRIGVADELADSGAHLDSVSYYSGDRRLGVLKMSKLNDTPYPFGLCNPQHRTEEIIRRRVVELGGHIESNVALIGLDNTGARPVATLLRSGDGTIEHVEPDWLIGADGSRSTVRELLNIQFAGTGQDVLFAICDGPLEASLPEHEMLYCYRDGGAMGLAPFGDGIFRLACAVPVWNDDDTPPRELFQENLDRVVPFDARVGELQWTTVFRARRRTAAQFRSGRCFLIGDAAHIFSAAGSQGMNTGFQDAVNLAWKLAGVRAGTLSATILDTYDHERRHSAERVSSITAKQTSWGLIRRPARVAVRDLLVRGAERTGTLQRVVTPLMSQLTTNYASSGESARADIRWWPRSVRPGERLPVFSQAISTGDGWPIIAADRLTVALWSGGTRDVEWQRTCTAITDALDPTIPVADLSGWPAFTRLLPAERCALLLRPDGHVHDLCRDPDTAQVRQMLALAGVGTAYEGTAQRVDNIEPAEVSL